MSARNGERARFIAIASGGAAYAPESGVMLKEQKALTAADFAPLARGSRGGPALGATEMAAASAAPVWKTVLSDSLGFVLVMWSIPAAILLVGTPIVLVVALVITLLQP
jgi:hypothetical protein